MVILGASVLGLALIPVFARAIRREDVSASRVTEGGAASAHS
jgi:hypothetical protein